MEMAALLAAGEAQRAEHELKYLCVTMSEKGIRVLWQGGEYHSPARAREVFDVSGAGDTVIATLAAVAGRGGSAGGDGGGAGESGGGDRRGEGGDGADCGA